MCRARLTRAFFPLLLIVACWTSADELSVIAVPIRSSLAPLQPEIEKRVPKEFKGDGTARRIDVHYEVSRDPIHLEMIGGGLHVSTSVHYAMQACRGRFPCLSCGFDEPRREAAIKFHTKLDWDPAWRLRSSTRLLPVHYAKPCEVTWFDIDITRLFIAPVVEKQLGLAAQIIDRNTPALTNIRPRAEQIWTSLQQPTELAPRTWLVLVPTEVGLTPISGSGSMVTSTLVLHAQTHVILGDKPAITPKPLPALKHVKPGFEPIARVPFTLDLTYDDASRLATGDYAGKTYKVNGRPLTIESLRLGPARNGRVLMEATIDYRGGALRNYRGAVFLEGTPRFDPASSSIIVPDLDYTLDAKRRGVFARIVERAAHDSIRQRLRNSARFALAPRIAALRGEVTRALTRQLAPGVFMRGRADEIEPQEVTPHANVISLKVVATGAVEVEVR